MTEAAARAGAELATSQGVAGSDAAAVAAAVCLSADTEAAGWASKAGAGDLAPLP